MPARVAYFCAEYGLDAKLPIYAGGLGVLAGDTLKAAADLGSSLFGIGLLYRGKRAKQEITKQGEQIEIDVEFDPTQLGLEHVYHLGQPLFVKVYLVDHFVWARVWKKQLGQGVELYLLDTNTSQNRQSDRDINDALYFGDQEKQLQQQFILGIGGAKLIDKLKLRPNVYHLNEGRPAFMFWQLLRQSKQQSNLDYYQAFSQLKQQIVYTNHTLVAAGNYFLPIEMLSRYARFYARELSVSLDELLAPGISQQHSGFSMTEFSLKIAHRHSGVSQLHTQLSQQIWPQYQWQAITNGIHLPTWQDETIRSRNLDEISDDELWQIHLRHKHSLERFVAQRTGYHYDSSRLVVGWARRLAGYKRLDAVFADIDRLQQIIKDKQRPVQLLIAGKAHQEDDSAKNLLKQVIKYMSDQLAGNALFIPNYDLDVAQHLVKGCDLWLNLPVRGQEACGTSGMKAISNGVLNCTTQDGWAQQVDWQGTGWVLPSDNVSQHFYRVLDEEIKPLFYRCDPEKEYSSDWVRMMKNSIELTQEFSAKRMLQAYQQQLYQSGN